MDAYDTDFAALGLNFHSPFDILQRLPRKAPVERKAQAKRGPKPGQAKSIVLKGTRMFTEEETLRRKAMRVNQWRSPGYTIADSDKTKKIVGKQNHRRSQ